MRELGKRGRGGRRRERGIREGGRKRGRDRERERGSEGVRERGSK